MTALERRNEALVDAERRRTNATRAAEQEYSETVARLRAKFEADLAAAAERRRAVVRPAHQAYNAAVIEAELMLAAASLVRAELSGIPHGAVPGSPVGLEVVAMTSTDQRMLHSDAFAWYMEKDPVLRSTVVAVDRLDRNRTGSCCAPDRPADPAVPRLRMRVQAPPLRMGRRGGRRRIASTWTTTCAASGWPAGGVGAGARVRPDGRNGRLRPGPAAVGVHPAGGTGRRPGRVRHEAAPLADRRHRR